jgi:RNA 3'-phosphate cyclase
MNNMPYIEIDGAIGEGGGAILRLSAGFSILYNCPIRIKNIRANRPQPGLRMQHLLGLSILADLTGSTLSHCEVGSRELTFLPNNMIKNRTIHINIPTAASIGLLLQPIQVACLGITSNEKITISLNGGGTFGKWAPSLNYLEHVTFPLFKKSGLQIEIETIKYGFYPKGGAQTLCSIELPKNELKPLNLIELGEIELIKGEIVISNQLKRNKSNIALRIKNSIRSELKGRYSADLDIKEKWVETLSPGVGLCLWAKSDTQAIISSGTVLGEPNLSSERLGKMTAADLMKYINNNIPVDDYLSDQLIPLMAHINKPSTIKVLQITNHTKTNLQLIAKFTKRKFEIIKEKKGFLIKFY